MTKEDKIAELEAALAAARAAFKKEGEKKRDICFMTSTGGLPHHIVIAKQKLDWLHAHGLGGHPVAFCMNTRGKGQYAYPGAILIDDRQKVCDAWVDGGGYAHIFTREWAMDIAAHFAS